MVQRSVNSRMRPFLYPAIFRTRLGLNNIAAKFAFIPVHSQILEMALKHVRFAVRWISKKYRQSNIEKNFLNFCTILQRTKKGNRETTSSSLEWKFCVSVVGIFFQNRDRWITGKLTVVTDRSNPVVALLFCTLVTPLPVIIYSVCWQQQCVWSQRIAPANANKYWSTELTPRRNLSHSVRMTNHCSLVYQHSLLLCLRILHSTIQSLE